MRASVYACVCVCVCVCVFVSSNCGGKRNLEIIMACIIEESFGVGVFIVVACRCDGES